MAKLVSTRKLGKEISQHKPLILLMDYDGTLSPIAPTPADAVPAEGALAVLESLALKKEASLGIVSGRPLKELKRRIPVEGIIFVGAHGAFIETNRGDLTSIVDVEKVRPALKKIHQATVKLTKGKGGFLIEDKSVSIALHFRLAEENEAEEVLSQWKTNIKPIIEKSHLELHFGKKVAEVRPKGADKGVAVNFILREFSSSHKFPIYIGDDTTDEDAFQVIRDKGITILVSDVKKKSAAQYRLRNPDEVVKLLKQITLDLS